MELEQLHQLTLGLRAAQRRGVAKSCATGCVARMAGSEGR